jgi:FkbM family methyltransferase
MIFLDIGAGRGDYAASILANFADAEVICYEATQRGIVHLRERFANEPRVTVVHGAVVPDGTKGPVKVYCGNHFWESSLSLTADGTYEEAPAICVSTLPVATTHIDTNGGEAVLRSALAAAVTHE